MKSLRALSLCIAICTIACHLMALDVETLRLSHASTVKITSVAGNSSGTGFLLSDHLVLTCFHVVSSVAQQGRVLSWTVYHDLQITMPSGDVIAGRVISIPTYEDPTPAGFDFAFIKLDHPPNHPAAKVSLAGDIELSELGDDVAFSGFPLNTPGMVTHRGMVSGTDPEKTLIFIEAPINKGNSGGALLNSKGHVVGIISMREGGISDALSELQAQIQGAQNGSDRTSVRIMGIDPLAASNSIITTLDLYISTGIGYARSIRFARDYQKRHPDQIQ